MTEKHNALTLNISRDDLLTLERSSLKDQAVELLRDYIISGRIPSGTKLVERDVATLLGVSRAPARDALMQLEVEGLIVSKSSGRYVIELNERDIREIFQIRLVLEKLAVELAAQYTTPEHQLMLNVLLQEMENAVESRDLALFVKNDVATHNAIWQLSGNRHLVDALAAMVGPIFLFVGSNAQHYDWSETLELHRELISSINAGDVQAAVASIERNIENGLQRSLRIVQSLEKN